jgi:hypothetical protein
MEGKVYRSERITVMSLEQQCAIPISLSLHLRSVTL